MPDPATISRLEMAAARRPRLYRASLTASAIGGAIALTAVLVLPLVFIPLIGALLIDHPIFYAIGAFALVLLVWLVQPLRRPSGRELRRDEAPVLFEAVAALPPTVGGPGNTGITVGDSVNSPAAESGRPLWAPRKPNPGVRLVPSLEPSR